MNAAVTSESFAITDSGLLDVFQVWRLNRACFPKDAYDLFTLLNMSVMPGITRLKAVTEGKIVGYVAGEINKRENCGWIITIGVHPKCAGHGIGTALLLASERSLNTNCVKLTVRRSNQRAIQLYERCGYKWVNTYRRYYHDGEDGLVMEKRL
jgi:ribosomal-protein-alanine N-acetyltransferase